MFRTPKTVKTRGRLRREQQLVMEENGQLGNMEVQSDTGVQVKEKVKVSSLEMKSEPKIHSKERRNEGSRKLSSRTMSSAARQKHLEYEAAQAKAKIELEELEERTKAAASKARIEKELLEKKLAADIADMHSEHSSRRSQLSSVPYEDKVQNWFERSVPAPGSSLHTNREYVPNCENKRFERQPAATAGESHTQGAIEALASALRDAVGVSASQTKNQELLTRLSTSKDLPVFFGDPMEWLQFKEAYHESTRLCNFSDTENLWRLRKCLRGEAKEATSSLLISAVSPKEVLETLELRFGRPENIMRKITYQLRKLPPLPLAYHSEIVNFSIKIKNFVATTRAIKQSDFLRSPEQVSIVVSKLPTALISKWADYMYENPDDSTPKLELLSTFLYKEATKIATSGVSYVQTVPDYKKRTEVHRTHNNQTVLVCTDTDNGPRNGTNKCNFCRKQNHSLSDCGKFKRAMRKDRWRFVRANKICFKCLGAHHEDPTACTADNCDVEGCGWPHHRLLHWSRPAGAAAAPRHPTVSASRHPTVSETRRRAESAARADRSPPPPDDDRQPNNELVTHTTTSQCTEMPVLVSKKSESSMSNECKVLLKIVPVTIYGPKVCVHTHALLDDGATVSLIAADIADKAGLHGERYTMRARSAWDSGELVCHSELINFAISSSDGEKYNLRARKIKELNLPVQCMSGINYDKYKQLCNNYNFCNCNTQPKLLIGQDNYDLIAPILCIKDRSGGPYITQTSLGWCVHGSLRSENKVPCLVSSIETSDVIDCQCIDDVYKVPTVAQVRISHVPAPPPPAPPPSCSGADETSYHSTPTTYAIHNYDSHSCIERRGHCYDSDTELHEFVRRSFSLDSIGIGVKPRQNINELRAINILDNTSELINGQWSVGLPWKYDNFSMPDSYPTAFFRLKSVERKMYHNHEYAARYRERVQHLFLNDYARELTDSEISSTSSRAWYLPHFGVDNPNKQKLRLVFDAAAKTKGFSLNDYLLQGPDLLQSLYGVMFRFREQPIGIIGDIRDMFLRIKIKNDDQHALRFLWKEKDQLKKYAMTSLIFGANCSPFIAQYVNQIINTERFKLTMSEAVGAIRCNQYIDDYIDSFLDKSVSIKMMKDICYIHQQGGFEMRNWSSNEPSVLSNMPRESLSEKAITFSQPERALGLLWYPESDTLAFDLSLKRIPEEVLQFKRKPTKREVLRMVMSIFDIHGYLGPFTIKGKILMRETWKSDIKWDEAINDNLFIIFREWITQMKVLNQIRIPRWYFRKNEFSLNSASASETDLELHVFCDASPSAYAAVAYWRKESIDGRVLVSFIVSKSRVTPSKPVSVPRLELQGALLACRLADSIQKEHRIKPKAVYYWTDSTTVLHWIRNQCRNYKVFIANRLGEIDELSKTQEWHYVPTNLNIADVASKNTDYKLESDSEWFTGPSFLYQQRSSWPRDPERKENISDEILEKVHAVYERNKDCDLPVPEPSRFSSWLRLLRATATVLLFIEKFKKRNINSINDELMRKAEILLFRYSQAQSFPCEISCLKQNKSIKNNSRLRTLTPTIDENNLLRVGGRIGAAKDVDRQTKYPVILDGQNHVSRLIVMHYHVQAAHSCNEMVINELRQKYWIIRLRPTVRTVAARCLICRMNKASPDPPRLGNLPEGRLLHHQRAFTVCGIDLFGPMEVTVGRQRHRRYGVLFTCLTVRAIHIELVSTLTTDSLIMALRRMASRRGWPKIINSDNGTNLRGADTELKKAYQELLNDQQSLVAQALNKGVNWQFIPPVSPHMGGAWERLIRSVKTALKVVLKERAPKEETLATLLCEVENMVNSRPLTHVSVDPRDNEALTPNHFLIGSSSNLPLPGVFDDCDLYLRKQWRTAQRLADLFWSRWMKEVLPTLVPRKKWFQEGTQLKTGDLVVVVDPSSPRNTWPKGVVQNVYPGADGRVRVLDIKTKSGIMKRPATRVALLFSDDSDECRNNDTRGQDVDDDNGHL